MGITGVKFTRTFQGWKDRGFHVIKGEKSRWRDSNGDPVFTKDQVEPNVQRYDRFPNGYEDGYEREDFWF